MDPRPPSFLGPGRALWLSSLPSWRESPDRRSYVLAYPADQLPKQSPQSVPPALERAAAERVFRRRYSDSKRGRTWRFTPPHAVGLRRVGSAQAGMRLPFISYLSAPATGPGTGPSIDQDHCQGTILDLDCLGASGARGGRRIRSAQAIRLSMVAATVMADTSPPPPG